MVCGDIAARVRTETNTLTLSICKKPRLKEVTSPSFSHTVLYHNLSACQQPTARSDIVSTGDKASRFSSPSLLGVSRGSCVGAQQGLDKPSFSRREKRNENADDVSPAKQLLAHALIFTLGNNKHESLGRIAGPWVMVIQPCFTVTTWKKQMWHLHFWDTCGVFLNPHF